MTATFRLQGTGAGAVRAVQDLNRELDKTEKGFQGSAREASKLERAAGQVVKANESPLERYNRKVRETAQLVAKGALSHDQATVAVQRYSAQLERAGKQGQQSFGAAAIAQLGAYAAGFFGISAAMGQVVGVLTDLNQAAVQAAQRVRDALGETGELAQVGTPEETGALTRNIRNRGIVVDKKGAARLAFQLLSSGVTGQGQEDILRLAEQGLIASENVEPVASAARKLQRGSGLPSIEATLDVAQQAALTTQAELASTTTALLSVLPSAKQQKVPFFQVAAAVATVESELATIGDAATSVESLLDAAQKKGIAGKTFPDIVANVQARIDKGETAIGILGRKEAVRGFSILQEKSGLFNEQLGLISTADERNVAATAAAQLSDDPQFRAGLFARRAQGQLAVAEEERDAERANILSLIRSRTKERTSGIRRGVEPRALDLLDLLGGDNLLIQEQLRRDRSGEQDFYTTEEEQLMRDYLRRTAESNERMERRSAGAPNGRAE